MPFLDLPCSQDTRDAFLPSYLPTFLPSYYLHATWQARKMTKDGFRSNLRGQGPGGTDLPAEWLAQVLNHSPPLALTTSDLLASERAACRCA